MTPEQESVLQAIQQKQNVFITAPAGYGKSYVIHRVVQWAKESNIPFGVTAMTGAAALLINGRTLHSFLGIGIGKGTAEELASQSKKYIQRKLRKLSLLIVDEISMLDHQLFDKISLYLSILRKQETVPFGGVQLVFSGDMFQLPPVKGDYCFTSKIWSQCQFQVISLTKNMRQQHDPTFQKILDSVRYGKCTKEALTHLQSLKTTEFSNGIMPTRLYSLNTDVDCINKAELQDLINTTQPVLMSYPTHYSSTIPQAKLIAKTMNIPETIQLCKDAQVVLTRNVNVENGLVNGSRGIVLKVEDTSALIQFQNGVIYAVAYYNHEEDKNILFSYLPLKLAYALSIHKCQGMTLDAIEIDLGDSIFCYGQAYTALSRAKNLESVRVIDVHPRSFRTHPNVIEFYKN
jgi:ATP-dependent DNA helicase PIF1